MAFSLASPPSPALKSSSLIHSVGPTTHSCTLWNKRQISRRIISAKASEDGSDDDKPGFNPFGFVTDNPSSRSAIQLPEIPAEDGNVGQMLYSSFTGSFERNRRTVVFLHGAPTQSYSYRVDMSQRAEDKGKEYGLYVKSGGLRWFVRETGQSRLLRTVVFLVMSQVKLIQAFLLNNFT